MPCGLSTNANFYYSIPISFSAVSTCSSPNCILIDSQHFTLLNYVQSNLTAGNTLVLSFNLKNPPTTQQITGNFTILVSDPVYATFSVTTSLSSTVIYQAGSLSSFSISLNSTKAGVQCSYTLSMQTNHLVPSGSVITFTFPSDVNYASSTLGSITIGQSIISLATYTIGSLTILNAFPLSVNSSQNITVVLNGIVNPLTTGTFSGFNVNLTCNGSQIDSSLGQAITINTPGDSSVSSTLSNSTNGALSTYTFTFSSANYDLPYKGINPNYMSVYIPPEVPTCNISTITPVSNNIVIGNPVNGNPFSYKMNINSPTRTIQFSIQCQNPYSSNITSPFTLTLLSSDGISALLTGKTSIQTNIGRALIISSPITNTPTYPGYQSIVTFQITRADTTIPINKILIQVPNANTSVIGQVTNMPNAVCNYSGTTLQVLFSNSISTPTFAFSNIGSANPISVSSAASTPPFIVQTFVYYMGQYYLVDQASNAGYLSVTCNSPCKTCVTGYPNNCKACVQLTQNYYLFPDLQTCKYDDGSSTVCGSGYLRDPISLTCLKCDSSCNQCSVTQTNCTSCSNSSQVLFNNVCVNSCGIGYFVPTGSSTCQPCSSPCATCSTLSTNCLSCVSSYFLRNGACVTDCGSQLYADVATASCKSCDLNSCFNCAGSPTTCTSCLGNFLNGTSCISAASCTSDLQHVADSTTWTCLPCSSPCLQCQVSVTQCTACSSPLSLYGQTCIGSCPSHYYMSNGACLPCSSSCNECAGSSTSCTSCYSGNYLQTDTSTCVVACGTNYYLSGTYCRLCDSSCYTCSGSASSCTSCPKNLLLYNSQCLSICPTSTFVQETSCIDCNPICATCSGSSNTCTSCTANSYFNINTCSSSCPAGKTALGNICTPCSAQCATCSGKVDYCTSCSSSTEYAYAGICYTSCPLNTLKSKNTTLGLSCEACFNGCDSCAWGSGNYSGSQNCTKCSSGYKILFGNCYTACPAGYLTTSDNLSCYLNITSPIETNLSAANSTILTYVPFPHLITTACLLTVGFAGKARDHRSMIVSNTVFLWSVLLFSAFIFQAFLSFLHDCLSVLVVTAISISIHGSLNILFLLAYKTRIMQDKGFVSWSTIHVYAKSWIVGLSTFITLQANRLYFSRFIGFSLFSVQFSDFANIFGPINLFSVIHIIFCLLPIIVIDILGLSQISWGSQLSITLVETLILSLLIACLLCYDMSQTKKDQELLASETNYSAIKEDSNIITVAEFSKPFAEEELRQKILEEIFSRIGLTRSEMSRSENTDALESSLLPTITFRKMKSTRQKSQPDLFGTCLLEKEPSHSKSCPCSPKEQNKKERRKKSYIMKEEPPAICPDNVYSEVKPPKDKNIIAVKQTIESSAQTPPFCAFQDIRKHMNVQANRKRKKSSKRLFEGDTSGEHLEIIQESFEDTEENNALRAQKKVVPETVPEKIPEEIKEFEQSQLEKVVVLESEKPKDEENLSSHENKENTNPTDQDQTPSCSETCQRKPSENESVIIIIKPEEKKQQVIIEELVIEDTEQKPSIAEKDSSKFSQARGNTQSPPQKMHETQDSVLSTPLNPIQINHQTTEKKDTDVKQIENKTLTEMQKTPEVFQVTEGFEFSIKNILQEEKIENSKEEEKKIEPVKVEEAPQVIDDADLMGSFERDPEDNSILIRENVEGSLIDMRGRIVNKHGYLIDNEGNVINRKGEVIFGKEDVEREFGECEPSVRPALTKEATNENTINIIQDQKEELDEKLEEAGNATRKSASLNSLMEDTPSNYNNQNQRYDDPLGNQKENNNKKPPVQIKEEKKNQNTGKGKWKKDTSKSASKREAEILFKKAKQLPSFASDDGDILPAIKDKWAQKKTNKENIINTKAAKPMTARTNIRQHPANERRTKSRKPTRGESNVKANCVADNNQNGKAYGGNIEDMFLYSDGEDEISIGSGVMSNASKASTKALAPKLKGLENIYLQRLETSISQNKRRVKKRKIIVSQDKTGIPSSGIPGSESEHDEIATLLSENYIAMNNEFFKAPPITNSTPQEIKIEEPTNLNSKGGIRKKYRNQKKKE